MKLYNCVMISLQNPALNLVHQDLIKNHIEYLSREQAESCGWKGIVEDDPHVTLIYDLQPPIGRNRLYHYIKIQNRDEYNGIKNLGMITLDNPVIDTFEQDEYRVLKVNLKNSNGYKELRALSDKLMELPNEFKYGGDGYNPHLTLCYLKKDAPDSIVESINNKYAKLLDKFIIGEFIISGNDEEGQVDHQYRFS